MITKGTQAGASPAVTNGDVGPILLAAKPFDGTDGPLSAARWVALREERPLHVVSVIEPPDPLVPAPAFAALPIRESGVEREAIAARLLRDTLAQAPDCRSIEVDVIDGSGPASVVDVARERDARMIVIGTGRHDAVGRYIYGERALQIVRISDRPVLVVPRAFTGGTLRHVVVAVDFGHVALRAVKAVLPLLSQGTKLTLAHVKRPAINGARSPVRTDDDGRSAELFTRFEAMLEIPPGVTVQNRVLWGEPAAAIEEYARTSAANLVVCGRRRSHTLAERLLNGSVSAGLVRCGTCAVLIVPAAERESGDIMDAALTGVERWSRGEWAVRFAAFAERNRGRVVRLGVEVDAMHSGKCVAQDYALYAIHTHDGADQVSITLGDRSLALSNLVVRLEEVRGVTLLKDITGGDCQLVLENPSGRATLSVAMLEN